MKTPLDKIKELINPMLTTGEELVSVGYYKTGPATIFGLSDWVYLFAIKHYYIAITNKRLYMFSTDYIGQVKEINIVVPLIYVDIDGKKLFIKTSEDGKYQKFVRQAFIDKSKAQDVERAIMQGKKN